MLETFGELDYAKIAAELVGSPGAEFAQGHHTVIDPAFTTPRWGVGISRLLTRFPFERNVFCMTRFPKDENDTRFLDPVKGVVDTLRSTLQHHGLTLHLASDRQADDDLFGNVGAYMWACKFGIGLLEDRAGSGLNYNVVMELGAMLMTGRRCAFLRDRTAPPLPTDLSDQIYKPVDFNDIDAVAREAHLWVAEDLALGRCQECPPGGRAEPIEDAARAG